MGKLAWLVGLNYSSKRRSLILVLLLLVPLLSLNVLAQDGTIADIVTETRSLSTLERVIGLVPEVGEVLAGEGEYTLFAPLNFAFEGVPAEALALILDDTELLTAILQYHIVEGVYSSADLTDGVELTPLSGETLTIAIAEDGVPTLNGARIFNKDIAASNGVVHTINNVLIPRSVVLPEAATPETVDPSTIPGLVNPHGFAFPTSVTIAGTFQDDLGCEAEWQPPCDITYLTYDAADDVWQGTFELAAGEYEYKVALNDAWTENYGLYAVPSGLNIPLVVAEDGPVKFYYDHETGWITDNVNSLIVTLPGSYQDEFGCPGDWNTDCLLSWAQDADGDGIYSLTTPFIPAGDYEIKVAIGETWDLNYGANGEQNGANIPFNVPADGTLMTFEFDSSTNLLTITAGEVVNVERPEPAAPPDANAPVAQPNNVSIPGTVNTPMGCPGDWQPDCPNAQLTLDETDGVWHGSFDLPAGDYEYKVAINNTWDENYGGFADPGGPNVPLSLAEDTTVSFYYDHATHWVADSVHDVIAVAPGSFQSEIGCPGDWQPDCFRSWLQDPDGDGIYTFVTSQIPAGSWEVKVAYNGTWDENYGDGGVQDGPNIGFTVAEEGSEVYFEYDPETKILTVSALGAPKGDISRARAHWVLADTLAWEVDDPAAEYRLYYSPDGALRLSAAGIDGGEFLTLTYDEAGLPAEILEKFPHLANMAALHISEADLALVPEILRGQIAIIAFDTEGAVIDATALQFAGALDDLYTYNGALGLRFDADRIPIISVWAPTAKNVQFHLFDDSAAETTSTVLPMTRDDTTGVWSITGETDWYGKFYLFEVEVYVRQAGEVVTNLVTDPYSYSLTMNSTRSQIIDPFDPALIPDGWNEMVKPPLEAPEDIVVYELHIRDFSIYDETVPEELRGKYGAFTVSDSAGMRHLSALAEAGLTHLHLLPSFDIATINENAAEHIEPDVAQLASFPPDSEEQQALIDPIRDQDGFNWGYDPFHFNVPEGSYSTDPDGAGRLLEYRQMVMGLNNIGLRVVIDVVYNHTNSSGQSARSVFDRIVPGYYHRLDSNGFVTNSTCCANTATEHNMMEKFMVDSVVYWAKAFKIDAYRFDLMGHHMLRNMQAVQSAVGALTLEADGVDGSSIYIYGEGWNFGEVADNARGVNATQLNIGGTGIGVFNDRLRDAVRGGSPFDNREWQGFITDLALNPNGITGGTEAEQLDRMLLFGDQIRVGIAGNLRDYSFIGRTGEVVTGTDVDYNGSPAGYTLDPQENIVYISKHDNETLWDIILYKQLDLPLSEMIRMHNLGISIVMYSQGVPFFQAGDDLLRSKSLDRNSYNSGDWFNRLDFSYQTNNFGVGLPPAADNRERWDIMRPILANPELVPTSDDIMLAVNHFQEALSIRRSSPLFRLRTGEQVMERLVFYNLGPEQIPGLIVMSLDDRVEGEDLDPNYEMVVVVFNAQGGEITFSDGAFVGLDLTLHPLLVESYDPEVRGSSFDAASNTFTVPGRTAAVFVLPE